MTLQEALTCIAPADAQAAADVHARWNAIAKPLGGLGLLEEAVCRLAGAQGNANPRVDRRILVVFCADNGVVEEGVSQTGREVTAMVAANLCQGRTATNIMAKMANCEVWPVDAGMAEELSHPSLEVIKCARGTENMARGPAMTRDQCLYAIEGGISLAAACLDRAADVLLAGEMGIGNTTSSSAVASVLLEKEPAVLTGRGAGLSREGMERKVAAIEKAIACNQPNLQDPVDVLAKVGGYDIAAMCGFYLGAAALGLPVILDGMISSVAALCAQRLCPASTDYMIASHLSAEPAAKQVLAALGLRPAIAADMHLGEGSGAVAFLPLLDMALEVCRQGATFSDMDMDAYQAQE